MFRTAAPLLAVLLVFTAFVSWSPPAAAQSSSQATLLEVEGRVVDESGKPLRGVLVYGSTYEGRESSHDKNVTDEEGRFTLRLAAGRGHVSVQYEAWRAYEGREVQVGPEMADLAFTLRSPPPKTAVVEGRVVGPDGKPVEGAHVRLEQGCCSMYGGTAYGEGGGATDPAPPTTASPTPSDGGEAAGEGASGNVSTASASASSEPMARPAVMPIAPPCCYDEGQSVTTGADGAFRFTTYGGPRNLHVGAKGYAEEYATVEAKDGATVTKDVTLVKAPGRDALLRGRILDATTGAPVANAHVSLNNLEWSRYESATTGPDGAYELRALPGWSHLSVSHYGDEPRPMLADAGGDVAVDKMIAPAPMTPRYYQHVQALQVNAGEATLDVRLQPRPAPEVVVQGYVVDPVAKKGVPGAQVHVWNQDTGDWGRAVTDATGSWRMMVRPGHHTASSHAEGRLGGTVSFVVEEGEKLKRIDLQSPEGRTRYAPCDECETPAPMEARIAYAESGGHAQAMDADGAPSPVPAPPGAPQGMKTAMTSGASESAALAGGQDASAQGGQYVGGGGGLPAYDPAEAPRADAGTSTVSGAKNTVPAPAVLGALLALFAAAALVRRR